MLRVSFSARRALRRLLVHTVSVAALCAAAAAHAAGDGLTISGQPATSATMGQAYAFTPTVSDPSKRALRFGIWNKPTWAAFSTSSGEISGTPAAANVGAQTNITIFVTDGVSTAQLAPFTLTVHPPAADKPTISGTPATSDVAGTAYAFQPTASGPSGMTLSFSVQNKPAWANFSIATGMLSGTPTSSQTGTYSNIVLSVSDGAASSALAPFSITVTQATPTTGNATVTWVPPTQNTNGSALTNLAGLRIYYGSSPSSLTQMVQVASATQTSTTISNLASGVWYFAGVAYTSGGAQSAMSSVVSATIP